MAHGDGDGKKTNGHALSGAAGREGHPDKTQYSTPFRNRRARPRGGLFQRGRLSETRGADWVEK
jgi:hypothetical protein